jgi:hypothetical protein
MPLAEEHMFHALSYVWGDGRAIKEILLDGKPFKIAQNLYEVLLQLREQPGSPLKIGYPDDYFWIDAICLNQEDVDEKAQQIPRMMEIYHTSLKVVIWLGPNKPMTKLEKIGRRTDASPIDPFDRFLVGREGTSPDSTIKLLFEKARTLWTDWDLPDDPAEEEPVLRDVFGESYNAVLAASAELLRRPWFSRVWTVQECSLEVSPMVLAGRHRVDLDRLTKLLKVLALHHRIILYVPGYLRILALDHIDKQWHLKEQLEAQGQKSKTNMAQWILEILHCIGSAKATDPRDQIYGILCLVTHFCQKQLPIELQPNYRLPFEIIYWQYTAWLFENGGDLRLLSSDRNGLQGVPSWVPDFRYLHLAIKKTVHCEPVIHVSHDKRILSLHGIRMQHICDHVDEWYDPSKCQGGIQPELHLRMRYVEGRIFKPASLIRGVSLQGTLDDFLWKPTRVFNTGGITGARKAYADLRGYSSPNGAWVSKNRRPKTTEEFSKYFAIADSYRCPLVLLEDGTVLSVSRIAEEVDIMPGDIVCIFKGADAPSILRPCGQGDGFVLLTHCSIRFGTFYRQRFDEEFWTERELEEFRIF